tara:strand:+ start:428 stop:625 length:198 start_codon:yes stop_codon:yes gene_type:complete
MGKTKKLIDKTKVFNVPLTYEQCQTIEFAMELGRLKAIDKGRDDLDDLFSKTYLNFINSYRKAYK